jgi:hypothetical protein
MLASFDLSTQHEMSFNVSFLTTRMLLIKGCRVTTSPFSVVAVEMFSDITYEKN